MYSNLALAPDGRRVAVAFPGGGTGNRDIWIIDAARGTNSRLTFDAADENGPVWSPDGSRIAFQRITAGEPQVRAKWVSGTSNDQALAPDLGLIAPTDWSADGRFVVCQSTVVATGNGDVWVLPLSGSGKPIEIASTPFGESAGVFSPDGRWIAYQSNETGQLQVYVQPFPPTGEKYPVSKNGGAQPTWRSDSQELFFLGGAEYTMMAVPIETTRQFEAGIPRALFGTGVTVTALGRQYAVSKDGKRFLINVPQVRPSLAPLTVVVNWLAALQK